MCRKSKYEAVGFFLYLNLVIGNTNYFHKEVCHLPFDDVVIDLEHFLSCCLSKMPELISGAQTLVYLFLM